MLLLKKILIIRFSSIGDIVLTSPVIRCIKKEHPLSSIHFLTKTSFKDLVINNPNVDKVHFLQNDIITTCKILKAEKYDVILDLHHNIRTSIIKTLLWNIKSYSFNKENFKKWLHIHFKTKLTISHTVTRYLDSVKVLNVEDDKLGLDFFIDTKNNIDLQKNNIPQEYIALVLGAKFKTKQLPEDKIIGLCNAINKNIVLIGGKEDALLANNICFTSKNKNIINACGVFNLQQSASLLQQAESIITHDTGMMHIASAFNKKIKVIWGNTSPAIGFGPYLEKALVSNFEVQGLSCRSCSKIGFNNCPKKHFNCMQQQNILAIANS